MKEFIEKLIGRLEECEERYDDVSFAQLSEFGITLDYKYAEGKRDGVAESISIVNQLAEEYNNTSTDTSSGWIACSERLPDIEGNTSDTVLVCTIDGFQHMAFWCDDEKWRYCESGMIKKPMEWTEIIAWQPLPAPYKEGE